MVSGCGLVPKLSLECRGFVAGIGIDPVREGEDANSAGFFGRIAMERNASSSPKEP